MAKENISLPDLEFQFHNIGERSSKTWKQKDVERLLWIYDKVRNKGYSLLLYFPIGTSNKHISVYCGRFSKWDSGCMMS